MIDPVPNLLFAGQRMPQAPWRPSVLVFQELSEMKQQIGWVLAVTAAAMISEAAAQQYVYPAKGQSPQQQKSDQTACRRGRSSKRGSIQRSAHPSSRRQNHRRQRPARLLVAPLAAQ